MSNYKSRVQYSDVLVFVIISLKWLGLLDWFSGERILLLLWGQAVASLITAVILDS